MKKIYVNTNQKALVFKKGELVRVLNAGSHWLGFGETSVSYDMSKKFGSELAIEVLLQNQEFAEAINLVEVGDNELVLVYEGKNFRNLLSAGQHIFWRGIKEYEFVRVDISNLTIDSTIDKNLLEKQPLLHYVRSFKVEPHEQALLYLDGKFETILESGNYSWWKNSTNIQVVKTDMRQLTMDIAGQEILTKDKAQLRINFTLQYRVADILKALRDNREFDKQLYVVMQLAIREYVG